MGQIDAKEAYQLLFGKEPPKEVERLTESELYKAIYDKTIERGTDHEGDDLEKLKKMGAIREGTSQIDYNRIKNNLDNVIKIRTDLEEHEVQAGKRLEEWGKIHPLGKEKQIKNSVTEDDKVKITVTLGGTSTNLELTEREHIKFMALDGDKQLRMIKKLMPGVKVDELGEKEKTDLVESFNKSIINLPEPSVFASTMKSESVTESKIQTNTAPNPEMLLAAHFDAEIAQSNTENIKTNLSV